MIHSALYGKPCPGCGEEVGITMADEPYIILCGGNTPLHELDSSDESLCEIEHHGWTTAHQRCKDVALTNMAIRLN